jgi:trimeric autotransporter adhesin
MKLSAIRNLKSNKFALLLLCYFGAIGSMLAIDLNSVFAAGATAGDPIENQATGTYIDSFDNTEQSIESNIVKAEVAEVAGITVTSNGITGAPNPGATIYFSFTITNTGNDPTQFYIPNSANLTGNATQSNVQITGYNLNGSTPVTLATPITVTTSGQTGNNSSVNGLLTTNGGGIFQPGGTVTVRVPITINAGAASNDSITVRLGDTPEDSTSTTTPKARLQNQVYAAGSNDVYTVDNPNSLDPTKSAGQPINGDSQGRQEASAVQSTKVVLLPSISGTIFEDVNYGGGAGRNRSTSGGAIRPNVRLELYDLNGNYLGKTFTDTSGNYIFNQTNISTLASNTSYQVRVVNNFVTSSRAGACALAIDIDTPPASCTQVPVQTFRTDSGTADSNRVGGENPAKIDAAFNSSSQILATLNTGNNQVQSIATVAISNGPVTGIDFGFNFDTIVNTKDSGQGSLRQFIINSNALNNTNLAQVGQTAGKEVSIFMIPSGTARPGLSASIPTQLNSSGIAQIIFATTLPAITDANTTIDGSTQTTNIGDTNSGTLGYGGKVGTGNDGVVNTGDETILTAIDKPEVEIRGGSGNVVNINAADAIVRGIAIAATAGSNNVNNDGITIGANGNNFLVENSIIGTGASSFTDEGVGNRLAQAISGNSGASGAIVRNNLVGFVDSFGVIFGDANLLVERNRFGEVGTRSWAANSRSEQMRYFGSVGPAIIKNNYFGPTIVGQIDLGGAKNVTVENNTLTGGHTANSNDSYENGAIHARGGASNIVISHNIIANTKENAHGIMVQNTNAEGTVATKVKISQNSIYQSGKLGINLNPAGQNPAATNDGVTPNDGKTDANAGNNGMDYPIITSASFASNILTLKGYVGKETTPGSGDIDFAGAIIEFFGVDDDGNNNGPVFLTAGGSNISRPHGEGRKYLGTCTADNAGKFNCAVSVTGSIDPQQITATATDSLGNTSEFSATPNSKAGLLIVKRITAINSTQISSIVDNPNSTNDNDPNWPTGYLVGAIDGGKVQPGDEIEYTIYYLNSGDNSAKSIRICDRLSNNLNFQPQFDATDSSTIGKGIRLEAGNTAAEYLTNSSSDNDRGSFSTSSTLPTNCNLSNNTAINPSNNVVVIDLVDSNTYLPGLLNAANPSDAYGKIRFKTKVKP